MREEDRPSALPVAGGRGGPALFVIRRWPSVEPYLNV